jgi:hypothetical protein
VDQEIDNAKIRLGNKVYSENRQCGVLLDEQTKDREAGQRLGRRAETKKDQPAEDAIGAGPGDNKKNETKKDRLP